MSNLSHDENQIKYVTSFDDLVSIPFHNNMNAICWKRKLIGDFSEIIRKIELNEDMKILQKDELQELQLSENGQRARDILLSDWKSLKSQGASPILNVIKSYERDDAYPFFPTDVYSFHVDRSPIPTDTFLCTYHGKASEILPNSQGIQKIKVPEIRHELRKLYDGPEEGFDAFLSEYFFDLHYQPIANAKLVNLGVGHLWKLAVDHPEGKSLPCLHRAPLEKKGEKRLLMIC